jgi:hypothetical protein
MGLLRGGGIRVGGFFLGGGLPVGCRFGGLKDKTWLYNDAGDRTSTLLDSSDSCRMLKLLDCNYYLFGGDRLLAGGFGGLFFGRGGDFFGGDFFFNGGFAAFGSLGTAGRRRGGERRLVDGEGGLDLDLLATRPRLIALNSSA